TFLRDADKKREELQQSMQELREANVLIEQDLAAKQLLMAEAKTHISSTDETFRQMAEQLSQASAVYNEKNIEHIRQQNKVSTLQRELSYREKQIEELSNALETNRKSLNRNEEEAEQIADSIVEMEQILVESYGERKEREAALSE